MNGQLCGIYDAGMNGQLCGIYDAGMNGQLCGIYDTGMNGRGVHDGLMQYFEIFQCISFLVDIFT